MSNELIDIDALKEMIFSHCERRNIERAEGVDHCAIDHPAVERWNKICFALDTIKSALQPSLPQDAEEWIEHIDKSGIWWDGHRHVRLVDVRAFLAGKVLVPVPQVLYEGLCAFAYHCASGVLQGHDLDGGFIQDKMVELGLLTPEQRVVTCGEECNCTGFVDACDEKPEPFTCYRVHPKILETAQVVEIVGLGVDTSAEVGDEG